MALMRCPECQADVSSRAVSCPQCGHPLTGEVSVPARARQERPTPRSYITTRFALGWTAAALILGAMTMGFGMEGEEGGVAFTGMAIWGSSLVIWWKTRRAARAAALPGVAEIERLIEARLRSAEERFGGQLADAQDSGRQLMEMEERMEFMERLLTKVRDDQNRPT